MGVENSLVTGMGVEIGVATVGGVADKTTFGGVCFGCDIRSLGGGYTHSIPYLLQLTHSGLLSSHFYQISLQLYPVLVREPVWDD